MSQFNHSSSKRKAEFSAWRTGAIDGHTVVEPIAGRTEESLIAEDPTEEELEAIAAARTPESVMEDIEEVVDVLEDILRWVVFVVNTRMQQSPKKSVVGQSIAAPVVARVGAHRVLDLSVGSKGL